MMVDSKEARQTLEKQSRFLLQMRLQNANRIDCSRGAVFARWRGLGVLSLAWLDRAIAG